MNEKGQVAVEFMLMFIVVISVIIYAFYFAFSLASIHYRSYETFMIGRAILSSSKNYSDRLTSANTVKQGYDASDATSYPTTRNYVCDLGGTGFRGILDYGFPADFDVFSNAGIACSFNADYVLPSILTGSSGNTSKLAIESMTGSEMSDGHCECLVGDPKQTWGGCLDEHGGVANPLIDNGC